MLRSTNSMLLEFNAATSKHLSQHSSLRRTQVPAHYLNLHHEVENQPPSTPSILMNPFILFHSRITLACSRAIITHITAHFRITPVLYSSSEFMTGNIQEAKYISASNSIFQQLHVSYFIFKTTPYPPFNRIESNLILFWVTQSALNPPLDSINIVDVYQ